MNNYNIFSPEDDRKISHHAASSEYKQFMTNANSNIGGSSPTSAVPPSTQSGNNNNNSSSTFSRQLGSIRKAMHVINSYPYEDVPCEQRSETAQTAMHDITAMAKAAMSTPSFVCGKHLDELYQQHVVAATSAASTVPLSPSEKEAIYTQFQKQRLMGVAGRVWQQYLQSTDLRGLIAPHQQQSTDPQHLQTEDIAPACIDGIASKTPVTMEMRRAAMEAYPLLKKALKALPSAAPTAPPPPPQQQSLTAGATSHQPLLPQPSAPQQQRPNLPWASRNSNTANNPPAVSASGNNSAGAASGGFITATDQYNMDVQSGKVMPRPPAMGLKKNNPAAGQQPTIDAVISATHGNKNNGGQKKKDGDGGDGDEALIPPCLLLPDGTLDPRLEGLEPKLLAQVAMEILDGKSGKTEWSDIAGLQHAKDSVEEAIVWPLVNPDLFTGLRDPPRGLLLFGPPGTGKTMIARAIASRAGCTFMNISASSLMSKWVGEGEKLVRCMFAVACVKQPTVVFIDEIDSLLSMRSEGEMDAVRRVKTEFLVQMDGVGTDCNDRVLLIGATNRPEELDEAARRRMEKRLYIPLPDAASRTELLRRLISTHSHSLTPSEFETLGHETDGYSGADIKGLAREAAMGPVRSLKKAARGEASGGANVGISAATAHDVRPVSFKDCTNALKRIKPSVGSAELVRYEKWNDQYGSFPMNGGGGLDDDDDDDDE